MEIQEMRDLIAKKIAGQGTMVDVGGSLPAILNGILDKIAAIPAPKIIVSGKSWDEVLPGSFTTKASFASALGILESDVDDLLSCDDVRFTDASMRRTSTIRTDEEDISIFGGSDGTGDYGFAMVLKIRDSGYYLKKVEL